MTILETIRLRANAASVEPLIDRLLESVRADRDRLESVEVYRRAGLDSDLAVHIRRPGAAAGSGPGRAGVRLAAALAEFGLVRHTVWEEIS